MVQHEGRCIAAQYGTDGKPIKQVLVLDGVAYSFERVDDVLVGTHATLTDRQQELLVERTGALVSEWEQEVRVS